MSSPPEVFCDRSLGRYKVPARLRLLLPVVHAHDELFAQDVDDEVWLRTAGERGWIVLTRDDRILWGTSEAAYYPGNRVDAACDHSPAHYAALRDSFRRHFPALAELEFPYAWGGPICSTTRLTPFFGSALRSRVHYGLGYTGHGLGTTHIAGRILAHLALDRPSELFDLALVRRQPFPFPPEPLRSWAVAGVTRALRRVDAGARPGLLLRLLDRLGIGFSS